MARCVLDRARLVARLRPAIHAHRGRPIGQLAYLLEAQREFPGDPRLGEASRRFHTRLKRALCTLPGLLHPLHNLAVSFSSGVTVAGTGTFAGRTLMAVRTGSPSGSSVGTVFLDLTGPWSR